MYRLEDAAVQAFARHETFHPRYGWFRKGLAAAAHRPAVFAREDAPVELGVGKNMVRAIRSVSTQSVQNVILVDIDPAMIAAWRNELT